MVIKCSVLGCNAKQKENEYVSFHRFPLNDQKRLGRWILGTGRERWNPNKYSFICSQHFGEECFKYPTKGGAGKRVYLSKHAIPMVTNKSKQGRTRSTGVQVDESELAELPVKRRRLAKGDLDHTYSSSTSKDKTKTKTKIRVLQQKVRRLVTKNKSMKDMLKTLKKKSLLK